MTFNEKQILDRLFDIGRIVDELIDNTTNNLLPVLDALDDANQAVYDKVKSK